MRPTNLALLLSLLASGCRTVPEPDPSSSLRDTEIVTTGPRDQGGTAFCWAYAIVAHLEQRYYEQTRGASGGGMRLNFSEEYLGLVNMISQLIEGRPTSEGLKLSDSLALVDRFGIVPEAVQGQKLFAPIFDTELTQKVTEGALTYWGANLPENSPLPPTEAIRIVGDAAQLTESQRQFLAGAMGVGAPEAARFQFAGGTYSPQTWAKNRLKFSAADYYVLRFPDSGRGQFGTAPISPDYERALKIVKKAMLYGYSVPISFNFVQGSKAEGGAITCVEPACWDAELATSTPTWPHANHAVLLVDYRSEQSTFEAVSAATMTTAFDAPPVEWVIKNSWGFNNNTSRDPLLLRRYPLPAFTLMTQEFFEASHKLSPGRYEALVPRQVCLRGPTPARDWQCEPLVTSPTIFGTPTAEESSLSLAADRLAANVNGAALSRYPVEIVADTPELGPESDVLRLVPADLPQDGGEVPAVDLARELRVTDQAGDAFDLCAKVEPDSRIKYVAVYAAKAPSTAPTKAPRIILSEQNGWQHCARVPNEAQDLTIVLQGLDGRFAALGQITTKVVVSPPM